MTCRGERRSRRAKLAKGYEVRLIEPELSLSEQLLLNVRAGLAALARAAGLGPGALGAHLAANLAPPLQPLERELRRWQRLASVPPRALAYCFCTVE